MNGWLTAAVALASALFGGGGLAILVQAVVGKRQRGADVTERLSDASLRWVEQFQEEAASARHEAASARLEVAEARREVSECRREMEKVRTEAELLARQMRDIRVAVMSPNATVEQLRVMIGGIANGRP